jgi:hypothetical protein
MALVSVRGSRSYEARCSLSHSRSAAFMRVCHPRPVARNAAITSASKRIVVDTFAESDLGRPRRSPSRNSERPSSGGTSRPPIRQTASARSKSSFTISGSSSYSSGCTTWASTFSKLLLVELFFAFIGFPHRHSFRSVASDLHAIRCIYGKSAVKRHLIARSPEPSALKAVGGLGGCKVDLPSFPRKRESEGTRGGGKNVLQSAASFATPRSWP